MSSGYSLAKASLAKSALVEPAHTEYIPLSPPCSIDQLLGRIPPASLLTYPLSLQALATQLSRTSSAVLVKGLLNGRYPVPDTLCFVDRPPSEAQRQQLTQAFVLAPPALAEGLQCQTLLLCDDPRATFIDLVETLLNQCRISAFTSLKPAINGIDPTARIHPNAVIEADVAIGPGCEIAAGCVIKQGTVLLQDVVVRENTVMGCAGIARYVAQDGRVLRFPHLAGVLVEAGTEIGANCVIARGAMSSTRVGADSVIGNLCNVGHGVQLGKKTWMSVGCLIGGNCQFGHQVTLGLGVQVRDNLQLGDGVSVAMGSVVMRSVAAGCSVLGNPAKVVPGVVAGPDR